VTYDVILKNGQLLDGLGNPPVLGHIGIKNGNMFILSSDQKYKALEEIDVKGLVVAPGFVDVHSHTPESIIDKDMSENEGFVRQGVTTVVGSPDGYWSLQDFKMFKDTISQNGAGTNVAGYIGHNGVRKEAMGEDQQRAPNPEELDKMKRDIQTAMKLGALGLSTGLMYPPGMFSETDEVIELAKVASEYNGIYDSHIRNPVNDFLGSNIEVIRIAREASIPAKMGHLKAVGLGNKGKTKELIELVESALDEGLNLVSDQYPYDGAGGNLTLRSVVVPTGNPLTNQRLYSNPVSDFGPYLKKSKTRSEAKKYSENGINDGFSWIKAIGYDAFRIVDSPDYPELVGQYITNIAADRNVHQFDIISELILGSTRPIQVKGGIVESDVRTLLVQPWNMIASDGFAVNEDDPNVGHPRATGTFPKVLGHYVREEDILSLEEAVRKMTSFPADFVGLYSRGRLKDGLPADIVVFDPNTIIDQSTYTEPNKYSKGVIHVMVNGQFVLKNEEITSHRSGKFLVRER